MDGVGVGCWGQEVFIRGLTSGVPGSMGRASTVGRGSSHSAPPADATDLPRGGELVEGM